MSKPTTINVRNAIQNARTLSFRRAPSPLNGGGHCFDSRNSVSISAGAPILSDSLDFPVTQGTEISISLYFSKRVSSVTSHIFALKHAVVSTPGDHTRDENIQGGADSESSIAVSAVLVPAQPSQLNRRKSRRRA